MVRILQGLFPAKGAKHTTYYSQLGRGLTSQGPVPQYQHKRARKAQWREQVLSKSPNAREVWSGKTGPTSRGAGSLQVRVSAGIIRQDKSSSQSCDEAGKPAQLVIWSAGIHSQAQAHIKHGSSGAWRQGCGWRPQVRVVRAIKSYWCTQPFT